MSGELANRFPNLFFTIKQVEERTPKASLPSVAQVVSAVLVANGITNNSLAADIAKAVEDLNALQGKETEIT